MNGKQRCVIVLGFVVVLVMGLFPPWLMTSEACLGYPPWSVITGDPDSVSDDNVVGTRCVSYQRHAGYRLLFLPRKSFVSSTTAYDGTKTLVGRASGYHPCRVDTALLLIQWFLVSAVTGVIVMFLGDRRERLADKSDEGKPELEGMKYGRLPRNPGSEQEQ